MLNSVLRISTSVLFNHNNYLFKWHRGREVVMMIGSAILGDIPFKAGRYWPDQRDAIEAENGIFPVLPEHRNCNNIFISRLELL